MSNESKLTVRLLASLILIIVGAGLLISGFIVPPTGEIHSSVLVAFGETSTFAGALVGIDYTYRYHKFKNKKDKSDT